MTARAGFTYLEVLLAVLVLAGAAIAAAHTLAVARDGDDQDDRYRTAEALLQDAIVVVRRLPRIDTEAPRFGSEAGETTPDDADDLAGLIETGPTDLGGTSFAKDWTRTFEVASAPLDDPNGKAADGSTSLLRIRIGVAYAGAELTAETLWLARTP